MRRDWIAHGRTFLRRRGLFLGLGTIAVLLLAVAHYHSSRSRLVGAWELLLHGDVDAAARIFSRQRTSLWNRSEARAGYLLSQVLRRDDGLQLDSDFGSGASFKDMRALPLLLRRALREGRYESCLRLVELLRRGGLPAHSVYEAAALVELGREAEAERAWHPPAGRGQLSAFEHNVAVAMDLRHGGSQVGIYDRMGRRLGAVGQDGEFEPHLEVPPEVVPRGVPASQLDDLETRGLRLALDLELSRQALAALGRYRGSIVVLDPYTGDVLAAVSDRTSWLAGESTALEERREPASIAKLITTTAALRAGFDVDREIARMRCRGSVTLDDEILYCTAISGRLRGLSHALAVSCNVAFANLGVLVGRQALLDEYRRWGYSIAPADTSQPQGESPDKLAVFGEVVTPRGDQRQLADLAIGLEAADVTPVHAALMAAVTANGGLLLQPRLRVATDGFLGLTPYALPGEPGVAVLNPSWLPGLREAMAAVAGPHGTAARVAPRGYPVAMKTGTASHPRYGFHVNYIGFAPLQSPRYAFAVRITYQRTSRQARRAGLAVTRRLLHALARRPLGPWIESWNGLPHSGVVAEP